MWVDVKAIANVAGNVLDKKSSNFENLPEEQKEQNFLAKLDEIKHNNDFKNFENWWNKLSVKKKKQFYNDWDPISVKWSVKTALKAPGTLEVSKNPLKIPRVRWVPNPVFKHINPKKNITESIETSVYEQFPWLMRIWVSFWLLKKPWTLSEKKLLENIRSDANTLDTNLNTFREVCKHVPQLMAVGVVIEKLLPYAGRYKDHWAELMQEKIKNRKKKNTEKSTTYSLSHMEQNIVKSEVKWANNKKEKITSTEKPSNPVNPENTQVETNQENSSTSEFSQAA